MAIRKSLLFQSCDKNTSLTVCQANKDIPFDIARTFWITGFDSDTVRGKHAHYETQQVLVALAGSCKISLENLEGETTILTLTKEREIIHKDKLTWIEIFDASPDCILLVFCSTFYDSQDYITDYAKFKNLAPKDTPTEHEAKE